MRAIRRHNAHNSSRRRTRSLVNQLTWLRRTRQHCRYFRVCASHRNRRCSTIEVKLVRIRGRHNPKIFTSLLPAPTSQHLHRLPRQQVCHVFVRMARLSARSVALQGIKMAHDYSTAVARAERERGPQNPNEGAQPQCAFGHPHRPHAPCARFCHAAPWQEAQARPATRVAAPSPAGQRARTLRRAAGRRAQARRLLSYQYLRFSDLLRMVN